ncbi:MAG TPA: hypothetical protein VK937_18180 [Candidatus Limnocylindria bacterium]|jgi:hypothetical protein|nr:hypothetical protein [Candidatus Limnocylindria bacterium]
MTTTRPLTVTLDLDGGLALPKKIENPVATSTGSSETNRRSDFVVSFSTVGGLGGLRIVPDHSAESRQVIVLGNEGYSPLF